MFPQKHKSTIFGLLIVRLHYLLVLAVFCVLTSLAFLGASSGQTAYAATSSTLNFQGRLFNSNGSVVPDGYYNVQFKLYDGGTDGGPGGTGQANAGTNLWTESYYDSNGVTAGNDFRLRVVNGYFSANLGSQTAFGAINWDQELWLTMNVGGTTQTATPTYDGEMLAAGNARTKLTAVPYAFRAGAITDGAGNAYDADDLVQLAPGSVQGVNSANTAIRVNQTGAGNLLQLQSSSSDRLVIENDGDVVAAGDGTFQGGDLIVGTASVAGDLTLYDGSSNTGILQVAALGQNSVFILPDPGGASDTICLQTLANCAGSGDIVQDGNSFGAAVTIGTNDDYGVNIETNGTTKFSLSNTGAALFQNGTNSTTAFRIQNAAGSSLFNVDTTNGLVGTAATNAGSTDSQDFNVRTGNAAGATSNSGSLRLDVGTATGTTGSILIGTVNNASAITIGSSTQTGATTLGQSTATNTVNIAASAGNGSTQTLNIGNSGTAGSTTAITVGSLIGSSTTIVQGGTNGTAAVSLQAAAGGGISVGTINNNNVYIGTAATTGEIQIGGASQTGTITVGQSTGTNTINIGTVAGAGNTQTINIGTSNTATSTTNVTIGSLIGTGTTNIQSGSGNINLQAAGTATTGTVQIGAGGAGSTTPDLLNLDVKSNAGDPGGVNGSMYYNDAMGKFRCYEAGSWKDCDTNTAGSVDLQTAYDNGAAGDQVIELDATNDSLIFRNPSSGGSNGTGYVVTIDQQSTGAMGGLDVQSAGTGNLLRVRDTTATATDVFTIADGGATTLRNQSDSSAAFQIQNAAGESLLNVNTTSNSISLGNVTSYDTFTKLSDPASMPGNEVRTTAWSPNGLYMTVGSATATADRLTIYKRSGDTFTKLSDPASMPGSDVRNVAWSPDSQYLSVGSYNETADRLAIYKRSGDTFTKLTNPTDMPGNYVSTTAWSPDGQYLSVGTYASTANRFVIYKRSGDTFTKLSDPASMPGNGVRTLAWSPDGQYLTVGSDTNTGDRFTIYKRSGDTFTKLSDPADMPGGDVMTVSWSPDGQYLSVGNNNTYSSIRITIYKRSGDTFTKLSDPADLPDPIVTTTSWSPDGKYLSVGSLTGGSDRFTIYKRSGDTFTKLTSPATMPGSSLWTTSWSPDAQYLSVGSNTSTADRLTIYKRESIFNDIYGNVNIAGLLTATNIATTSDVSVGGNLIVSGATVLNSSLTIQNATGQSVFNVDVTSGRIGVNTARPTADLTFGQGSDREINVEARTSNAAGNNLTISAGMAGDGGSAYSGGNLILQGGDAAGTGNANGGSVTISGGAGTGTGVQGLVNLSTTAFSSASTQTFAASGSLTAGLVDQYSTVPVDATNVGLTVTIPVPNATNQVVGRVLYITAVDASEDFTLSLGGTSIEIAMKANSTATLIWNGVGWTAAGASSSTDLQSAYNNTLTSAGGAELVLNPSGGNADGLTIRNNGTTPIIGSLFEAQTSVGSNLFSVNNNAIEYAENGGAESSTFTMWTGTPAGGTVTRYTTVGNYVATGQASISVVAAATADQGAENTLSTALTNNLEYSVSLAVRSTANFSTLDVVYSPDGTNVGTVACATGSTVTEGKWTRINCTFTAPASGITASNAIFIRQSDATARTFYIDNLSVNVGAAANHAADGSVDLALGTNWTAFGTLDALTRDTATIYDTSGSVAVDTPNATDRGVRNNLDISPALNTQYLVTFYTRSSNTFNDIRVRYTPDGGSTFVSCVDYNTRSVSTTAFTRITCLFTTGATAVSDADLVIDQPTASDRIFYVDALSITLNTNTASNVQIGGGNLGGPTTLFTLDRSAGAPIASNNDAYLGSMYYDTTTGRIQCYEADGWGACGAAPDNYVNLNPEYAGAVLNGTGVGTMTADLCANETGVLTVNSTLCTSGESRNYYRWTSPQATQQTYSIYVSYQLPDTFNGFASDDTVQLVARADSTTNAAVTYEMFKSTGSTVTKCGSGETTVVTTANTWQSVGINGNEATGCALTSSSAGDFIIFKINVKANSNANAYVSTLSFTTTGR